MIFGYALEALKDGKAIARAAWETGSHLRITPEGLITFFAVHGNQRVVRNWSNVGDVLAEDWEILEEETKSIRATSIEALDAELVRARTKFPGNAKLLAALFEEGGELAKALLQRKSLEDVHKEAIQVACVAIRILEEGDADFATGEWGDAP